MAVAVSCCVAPTAILAVAGITVMAVIVFPVPTPDEPPHPTLMTTSENSNMERAETDRVILETF